MLIFGDVAVQQIAQHAGNVIFEDQVLLVDPFNHLATQAVNGLALLVHHVVVLKQVFAGFKVLAFDGLLCGLDAPRDQPDSMGTPSSMPSRCSSFDTHSLAKMRIKSSSSER